MKEINDFKFIEVNFFNEFVVSIFDVLNFFLMNFKICFECFVFF